MASRVYVVIVNWNGWRDTIECLESLFRTEYPDFRVVICDNASSDGSLERIEEWAAGVQAAGCANEELHHLTQPAICKPISCLRTDSSVEPQSAGENVGAKLVLIQTGKNLGFAGASNVGITYALEDAACQYVWLLNNDTVVEPASLSAMITHTEDKGLGTCGSLCLLYFEPEKVQMIGGPSLSKWTGRIFTTRGVLRDQVKLHVAGHKMDFICGASWLITRKCLEATGLLEESYFLYYEEPDFAMRSTGRYRMGFTIDSKVYHKGGASAGNSRNWSKRSLTAERFGARSRILFARRFHRQYLPFVVGAVMTGAFYRVIFGPRRNGVVMLQALWEGLIMSLAKPPFFSRQS